MKDTVKEVEFFDSTSDAYLKKYEEITPEGYSFRVRRDKVEQLIQSEKGQNKIVLDIGSGPGIMIEALLKSNFKVVAIDAAPQMIELTKKQFPNVESIVSDARKILKPDNTFDVATAMGLVEYFEEDGEFYTEMSRVLKSGGKLLVTYPNVWSPWRLWNRVFLMILRPIRAVLGIDTSKKSNNIRHKEYTVSAAKKEMEKFGFVIEDALYYNLRLVPYPFDDMFPRFTVKTSAFFERLDRGLFGWMATAFILKARNKKT